MELVETEDSNNLWYAVANGLDLSRRLKTMNPDSADASCHLNRDSAVASCLRVVRESASETLSTAASHLLPTCNLPSVQGTPDVVCSRIAPVVAKRAILQKAY